MVTEDYVSFDTAKLLKEKGFDGECDYLYVDGKILRAGWKFNWNSGETLFTDYKNECSAPTVQMAMKWLRKKYNLHIITLPYAPMDRHPYHPGEADIVYIAQLFRGIIPIDGIGRSVIKLTPEEACDAAIKYCLENLI